MRVGDSWRSSHPVTLASWFYGPQPESFCIPLPMANMVFIATNWPSSMTHAVPLWLAGLFYLFATQEGKRYRPIGWMFIIPFVLFVIGRGRGYYMAAGYPMLLAAGAVWGERWVASLSSRRALVIRMITWIAFAIGALVDAARPRLSCQLHRLDHSGGGLLMKSTEATSTRRSGGRSLSRPSPASAILYRSKRDPAWHPRRRIRSGWRNQSVRPCAEIAEGNLRDELSLASRVW